MTLSEDKSFFFQNYISHILNIKLLAPVLLEDSLKLDNTVIGNVVRQPVAVKKIIGYGGVLVSEQILSLSHLKL